MKTTTDNKSEDKTPVPMSAETEAKLKAVAELFKGKTMFPKMVARAKKMFEGINPTQAM